MSSGRKSSLVAQVWAQLAHVTVMIVMPFDEERAADVLALGTVDAVDGGRYLASMGCPEFGDGGDPVSGGFPPAKGLLTD